MNKLKQVFLLRSRGIQLQSIAKTLGSSRNTVKKYLKLANQTNLSLTDLAQMDEADLLKLFADPVQQSLDRYQDLERLFPWMSKELERTGVNRWGLWGEYKSMYPDGYSYSQFCEHYKQWSESENAVMHMDHKPGDKCFIDFTGKKLQIVDRVTGEIKDVEVYVAVLGFSQFTYVEALYNQKLGSFIQATENAIRYFGGVPCALVPDNLKSAVTKADKYEPTINEEFLDFANHYRTAILPARSRKPRDKAHVEKAVSIVYSRIFAPLRDQVFFSLYELNQAINELLKQYNDCCFQRENISRRQRFINEEKVSLYHSLTVHMRLKVTKKQK